MTCSRTVPIDSFRPSGDEELDSCVTIDRRQNLRETSFFGIVGSSPALETVVEETRIVASTDSTVLICGETGTGKELFARLVHDWSRRSNEPFIRMSCAAIPEGLLESELFGHEKGAFTSAVCQRIGRFEAAHRGTIFLDEVGEIPLSLQPKLLRVLQEHEFERLGSTHTMRVDVRVIAATNRSLGRLLETGQFRADLFYRLNVFPIELPPLRERPEDIPPLVRHFAKKAAERIHRPVPDVPPLAMAAMVDHPWPGNVRELENFIERAVILSPNGVLRIPPLNAKIQEARAILPESATLYNMERKHIIHILETTGGVIGGRHGAAIKLGLPRTTLISKMKRLEIAQERNRPWERSVRQQVNPMR
jgi:formate hydrogenlyase transcriptional activator